MDPDRSVVVGHRGGQARNYSADREAELVARVRKRDLRAFQELYWRVHPQLSRFLGNLLRQPTLADEVLNDTMMVVWERLDGFNGQSRLSTWVLAIAYRKAMQALRRRDEPVEMQSDAPDERDSTDPEISASRGRTSQTLRVALNQLSDDHRTVVELTYFHELGYREIAEIMDCPEATVKTRMFHARRNLKTMLAGEKSDWL